MADLPDLLGGKYDETIEHAARALDAAWNPDRYPVLAAMFRDYAQTALAAVLPGLLADAWDEGHADGLHDAHEYREHRKLRNPYRPEPTTGRPEPALGSTNSPNPTPSATQPLTEPHNTEGA